MQFIQITVLALAFSCASASAIAAKAPPAGATQPGATVETMESLRSEVAVLKAQLDVAKARADLDTALHAASASMSGLPEIVSIYGTGSSLSAILSMPDGSRVRVAKGDRIHGGYRVDAIDHSEVIVGRGKKRSALLFAPYSQSGQTQATGQPGMGMPMGTAPMPQLAMPAR
ncbi:MAG: type IV pilus biogenesis protein PilP [Burkholderiales bacterium]